MHTRSFMHEVCIIKGKFARKSINSLQLYGNPFHCDCRLLDFAHWVQASRVPRAAEPICLRPTRLANRTIASESQSQSNEHEARP